MTKDSKGANFAIGILMGVIGGVVAGVLLAPKEGKKTMEDIKTAVDDLKEKMSPELEKTKAKALDLIETVKCKLESELNKISENKKAKKLAEAKNKEHDIYCL
ncbi:MAG: YtxH domain-containing protein [Cyanobacteria bacterium SIG30]|nr:YtxH domain-containing protein [Cyanobacteria bacterium SIG30]